MLLTDSVTAFEVVGMTEKTQTTTASQNWTLAQDLEQKFDLYFIGLIFTVLGLSVQSASFPKSGSVYPWLELAAWAGLLAAGLAGLSRLEWVPVMYRHVAKKEVAEQDLGQIPNEEIIVVNTSRGQTQMMWEDIVLATRKTIDTNDQKARGISKKGLFKYKVQKWGFAAAVILLIAARGYKGVLVSLGKIS